MIVSLAEYFRCPPEFASTFMWQDTHKDAIDLSRIPSDSVMLEVLRRCSVDAHIEGGIAHLSFNPDEVIDYLRLERYEHHFNSDNHVLGSQYASIYYLLRPLLPLFIRRRILKAHLRGRCERTFPKWPVDTSVDDLLRQILILGVRSCGVESVPFIWFWPKRFSACVIMTHDVETAKGRDYCESLMKVNQEFGIPASFQLVPEERYAVPDQLLAAIRANGCEVNVQDLNHDGLLFRNRRQFLCRAKKINCYADSYNAKGFRSAILFRRQEWYDALRVEYDMSVPNIARFDPQAGGCCTVMPYFVGNVVELPVTTTQDYSLFYILKDYSLALWKQQAESIIRSDGLVSFIVHPDYVSGDRELKLYKELLAYLALLRRERNVWIATPGEVNKWWRQRAKMQVVRDGDAWRIEGSGSERASIAYATERDGQLKISFESTAVHA